MSHPVLCRVFSIVLALMCALMCLTGVTGLGKAEDVRSESKRKYNKMLERAATIEELEPLIEESEGYEKSSDDYENEQEQHDKDSAEHRMDIAENSATRGGLLQGADKLWEAKAQLEGLKVTLKNGIKQVKDGIAQISALEGVVGTLNAISQVTAPGNDRAAIAAAYTQASASCDAAIGCANALSAAAGSMGGDAGALSQAVQGLQALKGGIAAASGTVASDEAFNALNAAADAAIEDAGAKQTALATKQAALEAAQSAKETADALVQTTQTSLDTLDEADPGRAALETQLAAQQTAAADAQTAVTNAQTEVEAAQTAFDAAKQTATVNPKPVQTAGMLIGGVNSAIGAMQGATPTMSAALGASKTKLQTTLTELEGKQKELLNGANSVQGGLELIWWQLGELDKDAADYETRREQLQAEVDKLEELAEAVEQLKELEEEYNTNRAILLKNSEVKAAVDAGGDLAESSKAAAETMKSEYTRVYKLRMTACVLAIAGMLGLAVIPAAYEKVKSRALLILPAVLTALCGAAAEAIYAFLGTGHQYAAMFTAIIAVIYLLAAVPKNKQVSA